jgi:tetratricopeptide (TPR) repeat protein
MEDLDQAIDLLERSEARSPGAPPTLAALALAYGSKAFLYAGDDPQWDERTFATARRLLTLDPESAEGHFALGVYLWRPSQGFAVREALAALRKAEARRPDLGAAWHQHGLILYHVGHLEAARRHIDRALAIDPTDTLARSRLGPLAVYEGRNEEAVALLRALPSRVYPALKYQQLAWALLGLGRLDEAARAIEEGFRVEPLDRGGRLHVARAMWHALRRDRRRAEEDLAVAVGNEKRNGEFHHTAYCAGAVLATLGDLERAQDWIEEAARGGFPNWAYFERDAFLRPLRERPRFRAWLAALRREWESVPGEEWAVPQATHPGR